MVTDAVRAIKRAYSPEGINVGINLGRPAGGSVSEHLHVHVVPRWTGDANFMTTVAEHAHAAGGAGRHGRARSGPRGRASRLDQTMDADSASGDEVRDELPSDLDAERIRRRLPVPRQLAAPHPRCRSTWAWR